jgi:hypothetical protein
MHLHVQFLTIRCDGRCADFEWRARVQQLSRGRERAEIFLDFLDRACGRGTVELRLPSP